MAQKITSDSPGETNDDIGSVVDDGVVLSEIPTADKLTVGIPKKDELVRSIPHKELSARWIAKGIVFAFAGLTALFFLGALSVVIIVLLRSGGSAGAANVDTSAETVQKVITGTMVPLIESLSKFASTVFAPLLAFVLGYYFGERQHQ